MLGVLKGTMKRTVSIRRFFCTPKTHVYADGEDNDLNPLLCDNCHLLSLLLNFDSLQYETRSDYYFESRDFPRFDFGPNIGPFPIQK